MAKNDNTGKAGVISGFRIEQNIPVPSERERGKWAFLKDAKIGESFFILGRDEEAKKTARQAYQAALKTYGKKLLTRLSIGSANSGHKGKEGIQCFIAGIV